VVAVPTDMSHTLAVYSLKTGKILQKYTATKQVVDAMVTPDGLLVTLVDDVVAVREGTQLDKPLWSRKYEDATNQPRMLLAVNKDQVAVALQRNQIEVLNITGGGQVANTLRLDTSLFPLDAQFGEKALYVVGNGVNMGSQSRRVNVAAPGMQMQNAVIVRFDVDGNGEPAWKRAIEPEPNTASWAAPLVVGQQQVIVTVKNQRPDLPGKFVILDAKTGAVLDKNLTMLGRTAESKGDRTRANALGTPALLDGRLVVETLEGVTVYGK
jgi:outer membrane protein assembly factor BamB